ncbi:hypothetical protein HZZ13_20555 [Bradyrhizobium sp. CNPSo 4010]|uniref:Uncharacterized protein n=1 Tax=Bradyrhizobium agreste TaxID=2751811 RepID=A0ABS0PSJ1_9BRAD|nr:hypothetical protein [Bradyrhizobium agreste]MBH5400164.1 hypothetical protein [Bradyrhizobium agreste]
MRGLRYAASAGVLWPDAALLPARDGFQAAEPPRAAPDAAARQCVGSDVAERQCVESGAVAARQCAGPDVAPWLVAAAWPVDGTMALRDAPWLAAQPDGPLPVVLLV